VVLSHFNQFINNIVLCVNVLLRTWNSSIQLVAGKKKEVVKVDDWLGEVELVATKERSIDACRNSQEKMMEARMLIVRVRGESTHLEPISTEASTDES